MMTPPQAILFDLDGTLLDTAPDLGGALNQCLRSLGLPEKTYEEYRVESSNGALGLLKMGLGDQFEHCDIESLRHEFLSYYRQNISRHTRIFAGINTLLSELNKSGIPWGIVTNKPDFLTVPLLKNFSEFDGCKVCVSGDTFEQRKPHPMPLLKAAEALAVLPPNIWYVGDAERDMQAAQAASMTSVLARYGYLTQQDLQRHWHVDLEVAAPEDILLHING